MTERVHVAQADATGVEKAIQVRSDNPSGAYLGSHPGLVWLNTSDNKLYRESGGSAVGLEADVDLSGYAAVDHSHSGYADVSHSHAGYAVEEHTHSQYAEVAHSHAGYVEDSHAYQMSRIFTGFRKQSLHTFTGKTVRTVEWFNGRYVVGGNVVVGTLLPHEFGYVNSSSGAAIFTGICRKLRIIGSDLWAVGSSGNIAKSTDGFTWVENTTHPFGTTDLFSIDGDGGNNLVVVGAANRYAYSSNYGTSWSTLQNFPSPAYSDVYWYDVVYGEGKFVAVGIDIYSGNGYLAYSSNNGQTWTMVLGDESGADMTHLGYGGGKFIAVSGGSSVAAKAMYLSSDGVSWSPHASIGSITNAFSAIRHATLAGESLWIATAAPSSGAGQCLQVSYDDGVTWERKSLPLPLGVQRYVLDFVTNDNSIVLVGHNLLGQTTDDDSIVGSVGLYGF
jgi:hypothetical protein